MSSIRLMIRFTRPSVLLRRPLSTPSRRMTSLGNAKDHETTAVHRKRQSEKPLNPHITSPKNTKRTTSGTQTGELGTAMNAELGVGEMEGAKFKIEPLRRTGEDINTTRARLLCSYPLGSLSTYGSIDISVI